MSPPGEPCGGKVMTLHSSTWSGSKKRLSEHIASDDSENLISYSASLCGGLDADHQRP